MIHYIPDTNNRYSITQKGIVTSYYYIHNTGKLIKTKSLVCVFKDSNGKDAVNLNINKKVKTFAIKKLIYITFGYTICVNCNLKIYSDTKKLRCAKCTSANGLDIINITKSYCAKILMIKTSDLTDELYNIHKLNIQLKRLIKSKI